MAMEMDQPVDFSGSPNIFRRFAICFFDSCGQKIGIFQATKTYGFPEQKING